LVVDTEFVVSFVGDEIRLKPLPMFPPTAVADTAGLLAQRGKKRISEKELRAGLGKALQSCDAATRS